MPGSRITVLLNTPGGAEIKTKFLEIAKELGYKSESELGLKLVKSFISAYIESQIQLENPWKDIEWEIRFRN